jgi:hypothetical protein
MKNNTITVVIAATILIAGCGKKGASSTITPKDQTSAQLKATPVAQASITAWRAGDTTGAVSNFLAADWSARPLFAPDSTLSITEDQVRSFSADDNKTKAKDLGLQLDVLKRLAVAVTQAGTNSAAHGDFDQARKCFVSLGQFGAAMSEPEHVKLVQMVGLTIKKKADAELANIGQQP